MDEPDGSQADPLFPDEDYDMIPEEEDTDMDDDRHGVDDQMDVSLDMLPSHRPRY